MAIAVTCNHCGVRLRFKGEHAGKATKCRACGEPVEVRGETIPDHDVFISYSAKDKSVADAMCAALEATRIRCWIAPRDILAGKQWAGAILDAITDSKIMVLVYSANSNASPQVIREVDRAVSRNVTIVPFRIESVTMCKEMEYYIAAAHWLDALDPPLESHIERLTGTVQRLMAAAPDATSTTRAATKDSAPSAHVPLRWVVAGLAVMVATVLMVVVVLSGPAQSPINPVVAITPPSPAQTAVTQPADPAKGAEPLSPGSAVAKTAADGERRIDLIPLLILDRDGVTGEWRREADGGVTSWRVYDDFRSTFCHSRLRIPYRPPREYDFIIEFTVIKGGDEVGQMFDVNGHALRWVIGSAGGKLAGLEEVGGEPVRKGPYSMVADGLVAVGKRQRSVVQVRRDGVTVWVNDKKVMTCKEKPESYSISEYWNVGVGAIGVGTMNRTTFHRIELVEIDGAGVPTERLDRSLVNSNQPHGPLPDQPIKSLLELEPRQSQRVNTFGRQPDPTLLVDSKPCDRFISGGTPCSVIYDIPANAIGFRATGIGRVNAKGNKGEWRYVLEVDNVEMLISQRVTQGEQIKIELPIPAGAKTIELRTDPLGHRGNDSSAWAYPEFVLKAGG